MLLKLCTVVYHVGDLAAAKNFYTTLTGVEPYFDEPFYVGYQINGFEMGLDPDMNGVKEGNHHNAFWSVEDIGKTVEKACSIGATVVQPEQEVGGGIRVATLADPFGNHIGLITGV